MQKTALFIYSSNSYYQMVKVSYCQPPFGMLIKERSFSSDIYRFGFNGYEKDNELKGMNNSIDFGARIYDNRLGRFYSVDPITYPYWSPFQYDGNSPIFIKDVLGMGIGDPQKKAARQDKRYSRLEKRLSRKYSGDEDKLQYELGKRGSKKRYGSIIGREKAGLFTGKLDKNNSAT